MKPRDCVKVIDRMLSFIPEEQTSFRNDLLWNREDASYKAPEETLQWHRTAATLEKHIPKPIEDWEFCVLCIFTTKPVEEIRLMFK